MPIQVSSIVLLLALSARGQYHPFALEHGQENSQLASLPEYNYFYGVNDDFTGDRKSQEESRLGDNVRGRYSLLDADGSTRTVEYSVDSESGFNAVVRRDGDQVYLNNPTIEAVTAGYNYYQNRRPSTVSDIFTDSEGSTRFGSRTRLAQDASTGNVIDLRSGFGTHPVNGLRHISPQHHSFGDAHINQFYSRQREQVHDSQNEEIHPTNHRLSTAPIHFPGHRSRAYPSRAELSYNRYSLRPVEHVNPHRRFGYIHNFNNADLSGSINSPFTGTTESSVVVTTSHPEHSVRVGHSGPSGSEPFRPTLHQTGIDSQRFGLPQQENNNYGARINHNDRSLQAVSIRNEAVVTNALRPNILDNDRIQTPSQNDRITEVSSVERDSENRYFYPANTLPLDSRTPTHFFTGNLLDGGIAQTVFGHDSSSLINHLGVEPVHIPEPVTRGDSF